MTLAEKQARLIADLSALKNGQDRFSLLVSRAKNMPSIPPDQRTYDHLVPGCLAKLWLITKFENGKCWFTCDSDSLIVKAIAGTLCDLYTGQSPAEILSHNPDFLAPLGITQHLTPNRRNALSRVWQTIHQFAQAHQNGNTHSV